MEYALAKEVLDFFIPAMDENYFLNFYGGEPLLFFDLIKKIVSFLESENEKCGKKAKFSITTNGSLITEEVIQFFNENEFLVVLSFDGLAQETFRKKGSFKKIVSVIEKLLKYPNIKLDTNSVFTPETVKDLSQSLDFIMTLGVQRIRYSLSVLEPWDKESRFRFKEELIKLREIALGYYKRESRIPVENFTEFQEKKIYGCRAGIDRMAVTPEGEIWGCPLFPDYFKRQGKSPDSKKYCFGSLEEYRKNHNVVYPRISSNYARFSTDNFRTEKMDCFLCKKREHCSICPVNASFSGLPLGKIPQYICELQKIKIEVSEKVWREMAHHPSAEI